MPDFGHRKGPYVKKDSLQLFFEPFGAPGYAKIGDLAFGRFRSMLRSLCRITTSNMRSTYKVCFLCLTEAWQLITRL